MFGAGFTNAADTKIILTPTIPQAYKVTSFHFFLFCFFSFFVCILIILLSIYLIHLNLTSYEIVNAETFLSVFNNCIQKLTNLTPSESLT